MSARHTPGPFEVMKGSEAGDELRCSVVAVRGPLRFLVATIENGAPGDYCDTEFANALLFAAAPDLLETSKTLLRMLEAAYRQLGMWSDDNKRVAEAKAAIAHAEGGA